MFIKSLFDHNYWARDKILDGVEAIDAQHLLKPSALSYGTISGLLTHMLNVEHLWRVRCRDGQSPSRPLFDEPITEFEVLRNAWQIEEELMLAYVSRLDEPTLSEKIRYRGQSEGDFQNELWAILMQFIYHGTQHRSELALKLTELGHSVGNLDLIIYLGGSGSKGNC